MPEHAYIIPIGDSMEEKNNKTVYVVQKIKRHKGLQNAENMLFEPCKFCNEMIPVVNEKCGCGADLIHACQSGQKKEVLVGKKTEFIEIREYATKQNGEENSIVYYYECTKCKELYFTKLRIIK